MVTVVQFENGEPTYWRQGKTLDALRGGLNNKDECDKKIFIAISQYDFSGIESRFEILDGVWVLFG